MTKITAESSVHQLDDYRKTKFAPPDHEAGYEEREAFLIAMAACKGLSRLELAAAIRLGIYRNCTTGICNPGTNKLAKSLDVAPRSARRALDALETFGIIKRNRTAGGNHDQRNDIELFTPPARVTRNVIRRGDAATSPVDDDGTGDADDQGRGTNSAATGDVRLADKNPERTLSLNPEQRASGARAVLGEIQSICNEEKIPSAPYGAGIINGKDADMPTSTKTPADAEPLNLAPDLETLAQAIADAGGFGPTTQHMVDRLRGTERTNTIRRSYAIRRERFTAKKAAGAAT